MVDLPKNKKIILFDGVCNFCNDVINKIIAKDTKNVFVFASLQSEIGQKILKHIGLSNDLDTIVLYEPGIAYYVKSDAAIEIAKQIGGIYSLLRIGNLLPRRLRNLTYDYIARNRYKWYGKKDACMIPTPEMKAKFL
ncbi:thiol-disulfide oxidoreductase DCC family protein [Myroides ceti]|uniref:Thiol-disulfide oxidoreductase DCC family protein n=1 Tax=Paenimyroides ceti TaxID=395087 RepID=A0ABT8CT86_9FLAO|nr:thiol-disulfide oxidoreductase DCC family protein [Paenimyroides ceti]MDN3707351.1 thiol-disulfide oxidoreductase DCC family protein [Paenimyroides ceti]